MTVKILFVCGAIPSMAGIYLIVMALFALVVLAGLVAVAFSLNTTRKESERLGKKPKGYYMGLGIAMGLPLGIAFGLVMGNIAFGPGIGVAFGVAIGAALENRDKGKLRPLTDKEIQKKAMLFGIVALLIGLVAFLLVAFYT